MPDNIKCFNHEWRIGLVSLILSVLAGMIIFGVIAWLMA